VIQKRSGFRRRGNRTEGLPMEGASLKEIDAAATKSLRGEGKNKLTPTYGTRRFNAKPKGSGDGK